jgi:hypothetical protein
MTIDCTGTLGSLISSSVTGVAIFGAGIIVNLRGLTINGGTPISPGVNGIRYLQGARLNVEDCVIFSFGAASPDGFGILVNNTSGAAKLHVTNTVIRNSGTATSGGGIGLFPTGAAAVNLTLKNVQLPFNFRGIDVNTTGSSAGSTVVISGGAITHSIENGINVSTNANAVNLMIQGVTISNNVRGIITNGTGANTRVSSSVISHNGTAVSANGGGTLQSYKNNQIEFNSNNGTPIAQATLQ